MMSGYALTVHRFFMEHPSFRSAASNAERRAGKAGIWQNMSAFYF